MMKKPERMTASDARCWIAALGLTQADFADACGVIPRTIRYQLKRGWLAPVYAEMLRRLAEEKNASR